MLQSIGPIDELPRDRHWLAGLAILGEVVSKLGPSEVAEEIYEALLPYENQLAPIGLGVTTWGPVSRCLAQLAHRLDRKSTRLNSSHVAISYAVFCLKKKN